MITSLPQNGQLFQLSQVFSAYGYEPKRDTVPVTTVPSTVTGSKNRAIFVRSVLGGPPLHSKVRTPAAPPSNASVIMLQVSMLLIKRHIKRASDNFRAFGVSSSCCPLLASLHARSPLVSMPSSAIR